MSTVDYALLLRFRDLVTEPGGTIAEHRRIIRQFGYAWWGWWARSHESVPRTVFKQLFPTDGEPTEIILFDRGLMRLYQTSAAKAVVAPTHMSVTSPEIEATPEHYARGRYPAWFRLGTDILPIDVPLRIIARPTESKEFGSLEPGINGEPIELGRLSDERPTLWVITKTETRR